VARKKRLTHLDARGRARMVEVSEKAETMREAVASARVRMAKATLLAVMEGRVPKGDVLAVARVAAIQGLKRTPELIPLCHPVRVTGVDVDLLPEPEASAVRIGVRVRARDRTGVEMEALVAAGVAALTLYDMCKALDRGIEITDLRLEEKRGGKSGPWRRRPAGQ
jgi:cyclic pyranopterin phosphate synthase